MLLLPEGQTGETWKPSKKQSFFGNTGALDRKVRPHILSLRGLKFNLNASPLWYQCNIINSVRDTFLGFNLYICICII
jgi:hypothetical protein